MKKRMIVLVLVLCMLLALQPNAVAALDDARDGKRFYKIYLTAEITDMVTGETHAEYFGHDYIECMDENAPEAIAIRQDLIRQADEYLQSLLRPGTTTANRGTSGDAKFSNDSYRTETDENGNNITYRDKYFSYYIIYSADIVEDDTVWITEASVSVEADGLEVGRQISWPDDHPIANVTDPDARYSVSETAWMTAPRLDAEVFSGQVNPGTDYWAMIELTAGEKAKFTENAAIQANGDAPDESIRLDEKKLRFWLRFRIDLDKEPAPSATFTATSANTGTLSNVALGMAYAIDDGAVTAITDTSVYLMDLFPCTITVIRFGNGITTVDSDAQTINITKAAMPKAIMAKDCTNGNNNNGELIGVTADMEYKMSSADTWTNGTGNNVTGLVPGNYLVRVKASGTVLASEAATLTIAAYTPSGQVKAPIFTPAAGSYVGPQTVTMTCMTEDAEIYVIVGDKTPVLYSGPLTIDETTTLRAYATKKGMTDSTVVEATYTILPQTWSGTVNNGTGGGSATRTYPPTVTQPDNGSVTVSPKSPKKGDTVTITPEPDAGYAVEQILVTDKNGNAVEVTNNGDGTYSFTQPAGKVDVEITFMEDNTMLNFFVDVPANAYYYDAVLWAAENGITGGVDDVHFAPNAPCTRTQIVTFLWRAAGSPVVNYAMNFSDVPADAYYAEAVRWAVSQGITTGTGDGTTFSPDATCTRAQAMTFIYRSEQAQGGGMQGAWMFQNPFSDADLENYYGEAVMWAVANGITNGTSDTTFSPNNDCTRAQIVTFLFRCLGDE